MKKRANASFAGTIFFIVAMIGGIAGFVYWNWYQTLPERAETRVQNLLDMRAPEKALEVVEDALKVRPDSSELLVQRAEALQQLNRHEEAIVVFQKVAAKDSDFVTRARLGIDQSWRVLNAQQNRNAPQQQVEQRDTSKDLEEAMRRRRGR